MDTNDQGGDDAQTVGGIEPPRNPPGSERKPAIEVLEPGTTVGRYVIRKIIGRGGMGVVYVAYDPNLNRKLALKVLHTGKGSLSDPESARARLLREAQAMATIGHPNLVHVYDVGAINDSVFIAMEFVNGRTLREWKAEIGEEDWPEVLEKYIQAGQTLRDLHEQNLIHRDFKPDNVMLGFDGRVRVMDFGLARSTGEGNPADSMSTRDILNKSLTATGKILGTPAYMAPEQFLGEPTDERTDQFSFCVALYEALYGFRPFQGKNMTELAKAVMRGRIKLPGKTLVPDYILEVLIKGLQCTPEDRFDSMADLLEALGKGPTRSFDRPGILYTIMGLIGLSGLVLYYFSARALEQAREQTQQTEPRSTQAGKWDEDRQGVLHSDEIKKVSEIALSDTQRCVNRNASSKTVDGEITVRFLLDEDGKIEAWRTEEADVFDANIARCVAGMAGTWPFPKPSGGPAKISIPIVIKDGKPMLPKPEPPAEPVIPLANPQKTEHPSR